MTTLVRKFSKTPSKGPIHVQNALIEIMIEFWLTEIVSHLIRRKANFFMGRIAIIFGWAYTRNSKIDFCMAFSFIKTNIMCL